MAHSESPSIARISTAAFLAWVMPGLGHIFLGYWKRGLILLITISATFWGGIAIGGVRGTVDWNYGKAWFVAEMCTGSHLLAAVAWSKAIEPDDQPKTARVGPRPPIGHWLAVDTGMHFSGVAGLLNLLVIFDAIARADMTSRDRSGKEQRRS